MYYFTSDYTEGCTPEILEALAALILNKPAVTGSTHTVKQQPC